MSTPKELVLEQLHQFARFEASLKRPLIDAGLPDRPLSPGMVIHYLAVAC